MMITTRYPINVGLNLNVMIRNVSLSLSLYLFVSLSLHLYCCPPTISAASTGHTTHERFEFTVERHHARGQVHNL